MEEDALERIEASLEESFNELKAIPLYVSNKSPIKSPKNVESEMFKLKERLKEMESKESSLLSALKTMENKIKPYYTTSRRRRN